MIALYIPAIPIVFLDGIYNLKLGILLGPPHHHRLTGLQHLRSDCGRDIRFAGADCDLGAAIFADQNPESSLPFGMYGHARSVDLALCLRVANHSESNQSESDLYLVVVIL